MVQFCGLIGDQSLHIIALDNFNFVFGQAVQLINQFINLPVGRVEIDRNGKIVIVAGAGLPVASVSVLAEWKLRRDAGQA